MIPRLDSVVDLGRDKKRMSDEDSRRQPASVNKLLEAFFGPPESRTEIQLLADEVGLGKTFVALATALCRSGCYAEQTERRSSRPI